MERSQEYKRALVIHVLNQSKMIVCNNGADGGSQKNGTCKIILFNALRIIKKGEKHGKEIVNWKLGLRIWPL